MHLLGRMYKTKMKGFGLRILLIRMGSFKTQLSILPGQPNHEAILLGEIQEELLLMFSASL